MRLLQSHFCYAIFLNLWRCYIIEKLVLLMIGKSRKPRWFRGCQTLPCTYDLNANAWMTGEIFEAWIKKWDNESRKAKQSVALIVDNCAAHPSNINLTKIDLIFFSTIYDKPYPTLCMTKESSKRWKPTTVRPSLRNWLPPLTPDRLKMHANFLGSSICWMLWIRLSHPGLRYR